MKKLLLLAILIGMTAFHAQGKIREKRSIVRLETTMGNIRIALNDETPVHRDNFLKLVSEGFYDGTLFHRVVKDFVIQAGDPDSKQAPGGKILGEGGPGYMLAPEIGVSSNLVGINFQYSLYIPFFASWKTITYKCWHV